MVTCIVFGFVQHHTLKGGIFKRYFVSSVAQLMCKAVYVSFPVSSQIHIFASVSLLSLDEKHALVVDIMLSHSSQQERVDGSTRRMVRLKGA